MVQLVGRIEPRTRPDNILSSSRVSPCSTQPTRLLELLEGSVRSGHLVDAQEFHLILGPDQPQGGLALIQGQDHYFSALLGFIASSWL